MADQLTKLTPLGNLDKDTEYKLIKNGNYVDALDIIKQDDAGNVSGTVQPTKRNKHAFSLGEVTSSSRKKYRVKAPYKSGQYALSIESTNSGITLIDYNGPIEYDGVDGFSVQFYSLANFQAEGWTQYPGGQTTNVNIFNVSYPVIDGTTYIEFELTAYDYFDYTITSTGPNPLEVVCIQEIIPPRLAGPLKDIGSYDLLGDLWIFSTTQEVEPSVVDLTVAGVGPYVTIGGLQYYTGPVTTLGFTTDHEFQTGDFISITGSNISFLNGIFAVNNVPTSNSIGIVTDTAWSGSGTNFPADFSNLPGGEIITKDIIGIGEIGVAQKDLAADTWSYTRLLRSIELNFNTLHPMDSFAYKESTKKSIYYTDNYNTPSAFVYKGEYMTDGALEFINDNNTYSYGIINTETSLQLQVKPAAFKVLSQNNSGGNNIPGTKYYTVRQKTVDGQTTPMSTPHGPVIVYDLDPFNSPLNNGYSVAASQTESGTVGTTITIEVSNLEPGAFPLGEIILIETIGGVIISNIIHTFTIPFDGVYQYTHTGFEAKIAININEVLIAGLRSGLTMIKAKNINSVDSRAVLSNISTVSDIDLTEWSKTFTHDLTKDKIPESTLAKVGEYQDTKIAFDDLGLMMNETYRFSTRVYLRGIGWTPWYWVDDIKIDNNPENTVNPDNENRRNSTFDNYELTDNATTWFPGQFGSPSGGANNSMQNAYNNKSNIYNTDYNFAATPSLLGYWNQGFSWIEGQPTAPGDDIWGQTIGGWADFLQSTELGRYAVHTNYYVPKVSFNIDWDFIVPASNRKNLINEAIAIEFGIGDIPNTILSSGLGVSSVKIQGDPEDESDGYRLQSTETLFYPRGTVYEFDYHPYCLRTGPEAWAAMHISGGWYPPNQQGKFNIIPKYPWAGYRFPEQPPFTYESKYRCTACKQSVVSDIFSFYSPDTATVQSELGPSAGNDIIAGATHVLYHGSYGTVKCLGGSPRLSKNSIELWQYEEGPSVDSVWIPTLNNWRSNDGYDNGDWAFGIFSLLHPYGPEYSSVQEYKILDNAFIPDSGTGEIGIDGQLYSIRHESAHILTDDALSFNMPEPLILPNNLNTSAVTTLGDRNQRGDKAVYHIDGGLGNGLGPLYDRQDARKMDRGLHYVQLYKDTSASYPLIATTNYQKSGETSYFDGIPPTTIKVNGGDTSTSLFYYKHRNGFQPLHEVSSDVDANGIYKYLMGSSIGYVTQTRANIKAIKGYSDLVEDVTEDGAGVTRQDYDVSYPYTFYGPVGITNHYFQPNFTGIVEGESGSVGSLQVEQSALAAWHKCRTNNAIKYNDQTTIDHNYDFLDVISSSQATTFFPETIDPELNSKPTRIVWSNKKFPAELVDSYRNILPASYKDLDFTFGEINDHQDINGELFTLQNRKFQLQHFNSRGSLQAIPDSIDIVIGEGEVLARDGVTLSSYGTAHKWSVIKGASPGGKDVIYWFNHENGLFMRFGADGTVILSDRARMRSFSNNNTDWIANQYIPTKSYGIRGVWDDRFKEVIWTFIGIRETRGEWGLGNKYFVGDIVVGNTTNNYPLDDIPDLYVCIEAHNATDIATEPGSGFAESGRKWTSVSKDDPEYYSVFTLAFNELSNGFSTFYSHLPKTYMKWSNKFLSSNPLHRGELYEHRYGYDKWYEYEDVWKESEPFVEGVVNLSPDQSKKFIAMQSMSDNAPDKIELTTKKHESFLVASDFSPEDDAWRSPIKNDILTSSTSDPNDDTASLVGSYMRVKFKFFNGTYNKLNNLIIKIRARLRGIGS